MTQLNEMFDQLRAAAVAGLALPVPNAPEIEDELKPFVLRRMTRNEIGLMAARDETEKEAKKMLNRINILNKFGLQTDPTPADLRRDELIKFHATMLQDLFFWFIEENTGWRFTALLQRKDAEGNLVLIGLTAPEATAYFKRQQEAQQMAELISEYQVGSKLVN